MHLESHPSPMVGHLFCYVVSPPSRVAIAYAARRRTAKVPLRLA